MSNETRRIDITVNRFHTAALTDAEARRILADASEVLTTDDGANDVACRITFELQGSVTSFTVGDGSVDSEAEYNAVRATGGRVHVVRDITWCDGPAANLLGCADTPGDCIIVVRDADPAIEAVLWAHEFGHNRDLDHRDVANAVMNSIIDTPHRRVNREECAAFRDGPSPALREGGTIRRMPGGRGETPMDIKEFVRRRYIHGVPYEQASSYPPEVVPTLLEMLRDPDEEAHRANIVATLGMIGDPRAIRPLLDLFVEGDGQLSDREYKLRKTIVMSLGYLLNKTDSREVLEFLTQGLDPEAWSRMVKWDSPEDVSREHTQSQLTKMAIWGLALSGKSEAREALMSLQRAPHATFAESTGSLLSSVAQEAIDVHKAVAEQGLTDYHRR